MTNKYCQKYKERRRKKQEKDIKSYIKKKKTKCQKMLKADINIFLKKKKRKKGQFHREHNSNLSE